MKRTIYILLLLVLLGASQVFAARVNNVELSYQDGNTVAKIFVEGKVRFVHQTEEAKDGKPNRVIVDVLSATHQLGQKNFDRLPSCLVQAIRTSQYSVSPEQIVRVVFDLKETSIYRVDSDNESISVFFQDKKTAPFAAWMSTKEPVTETTKPVSEKQAKTPSTIARTDTKITAVPVTKASTPKEEPTPANTVTRNEKPATPPVVKTDTKVESKPETKPEAKPVVADVKPVKENKPVTTAKEPEKGKPVNQFADASDNQTVPAAPTTVKKLEPEPKQTPKTPPAKTKAATEATGNNSKTESKPAEKPKVTEPEQKSNSTTTSRFRRSPTSPTKIKGTLVAEFPKRLVVKYKARSYRDPFETLINDNRSYQGPVAERLPNVEGLKLVGIIEATGDSNRALFEDKEGYSYILKSGDKVKKGYVLRVESDRVYFQIFEYGWSRTVALQIEEY
ncbi:MAG: hypothetical protein ACOYVF_14040 [Candidatus Zixiibacteriota bacterium]